MTYEQGVVAGLLTSAMSAVESAANCTKSKTDEQELRDIHSRLSAIWRKQRSEPQDDVEGA